MNKRIKVLVSAVLATVMLVLCIPFTAAAAGATATKVTSVSEITDGNYIIAATKNNKTYAITGVSGSKTTVVEITVTNGTVSEVPASAVLTFTSVSGKDNTVTIKTSDGTNIGCKDGKGDMNTTATEWKISNGFSFVGGTNTSRALALSVASSPTFKNYATSNAGTADYAFELEVYKVSGTVEAPTLVWPFEDGDNVVVYNADAAGVISTTANGNKLSSVAATVNNGKVASAEGMAIFTVDFVDETTFYLIADGKYLTSGETGNALSLADAASNLAKWTLEVANGGYLVKNMTAEYNGGAQYLEYYSGKFTTYGKGTSSAYIINFYEVEAAQGGTTPTPTPTPDPKPNPDTGDSVVAYIAVAVVALFGIAYVSKKH